MGFWSSVGKAVIGKVVDNTLSRQNVRDAYSRDERFRQEDRAHFLQDRAYQVALDRTKIQTMVKDANAAGLHPLAMVGSQISSPVLNSFQSNTPPSAIAQSNPVDLAAIQLSDAQARLVNKQADFVDEQIADSRLARAKQAVTPDKLIEDIVNPQRTSHVKIGGGTLSSNPAFSDAQTYEDRYGELGGALMGLLNLPADAAHSFYKHTQSEYKKFTDKGGKFVPGVGFIPGGK